jgi:hypothetical protein
MTRHVGIVLLALGLLVALLRAADAPAPDNQEPGLRLNKKDKAGGPGDGAPPIEEAAPDAQTKELLARVAKNMGASEDRLKNQDPGTKTRQIQDEIVKDLDDLIKKAQQQQQSSSTSSSSSGGGGSSSQSASSQRSQGQASKQQKNNGTQQKPQSDGEKKKGAGEQKDQAGSGGKKDGQPQQSTDAAGGKQGGGGNSSAQKKSTIADLFRDVWGHLPETKRQEMDAYSRERFMPKYDELLRQYYRTISEQGRKKDGD